MGSIFLDVVLPVLGRLELDNEDVRDAALEIGRPIVSSIYPTSVGGSCCGQKQASLTCSPSMLLSLPPTDDLMYGLFVAGWMHLSLRANMSSNNYAALLSAARAPPVCAP